MGTDGPSEVEEIKRTSRFLRGSIAASLLDPLTGTVPEGDQQLLKFHGVYRQDDRDLRAERQRQKLEPAHGFMVRVRMAGGVVTPEQWLALDRLAEAYGGGSLRLTTRQTVQLHGVLKWRLRETIHDINASLLTTLGACGDVNRNVMVHPNPHASAHAQVYALAAQISERLAPRTTAYHEIWLGEEKVADSRGEVEPLYGETYLPRKFKIAVAVPPSNDVDVFAHDLGFIACVADGELQGFNVAVGGGMGMTYGDLRTLPRLGQVIGFCGPRDAVAVAETVVGIQREYGNRRDRKQARFKYTVADRGLEWLRQELASRLGRELGEPRPFRFTRTGDRYGWIEGADGRWHLTLYIESGRVQDTEGGALRTALREVARLHPGDFRMTPNQNLIVSGIPPQDKPGIETLLRRFGVSEGAPGDLRRNALSCVAFPTCGLAMSEAERYLPHLLEKVQAFLDEAGLADEEISVRMSGCPNGCARPYLGEIGFTGKGPGKYNLYLGAGFAGERLNALYLENVGESEILSALRPMILRFAKDRLPGERFGDFTLRQGYVQPSGSSQDFHRPAVSPAPPD